MFDQPGVKLHLTVDTMKHQMIQYLTERNLDLNGMVEAELDKLLANPEGVVAAISQQMARDLQAKIGEEIKAAISGVWYRTDIREQLQAAVTDAIRQSLIKNEEWRNRA